MLDAEQLEVLLWVRTICAMLVNASYAQQVLQIRLLIIFIEVFEIANDNEMAVGFAFGPQVVHKL